MERVSRIFQDKKLLAVLDGLLRKEKQLTALQALKTPYFAECVDSVVLMDDDDDEANDESNGGSLTDESLPLLDQGSSEVEKTTL